MRAVSPSCIEYVVGKEEDIKNEKYMTDIEKIELSQVIVMKTKTINKIKINEKVYKKIFNI